MFSQDVYDLSRVIWDAHVTFKIQKEENLQILKKHLQI